MEEGLSNTQIKNLLHIGYKSIRKYLSGDADIICRDGRSSIIRISSVAIFHTMISELIDTGSSYKEVYEQISKAGFEGSYSAMANYCLKHFGRKNGQHDNVSVPYYHVINRAAVLEHIWTGEPMDTYDKQFIYSMHPELFQLRDLTEQLRNTLNGDNPSQVINWINDAKNSGFDFFISLANGMSRDIEAIKNSILYTVTNAILEGNINRLKMIKRTMYGRAGYDLLRVKVLAAAVAG